MTQFEISFLDELRDALANPKEKFEGKCASVRLYGPQIVTRYFQFPKSSPGDLILGLKQEASENLSIPAQDVEVAYRILTQDDQQSAGIYIAIPKDLCTSYLECFNGYGLLPVELTSSILGATEDILKEQPISKDNVCVINFLNPAIVNIIILSEQKPVFFRELMNLSGKELEENIVNTIRYFASRSTSKVIDQVVFSGDLSEKADLIKKLKGMENTFSTQTQPVIPLANLSWSGLNLWHQYTLSVQERTKIVSVLVTATVLVALWVVMLMVNFSQGSSQVRDLRAKVNLTAYNHANDLKEQIRRLSHAQ